MSLTTPRPRFRGAAILIAALGLALGLGLAGGFAAHAEPVHGCECEGRHRPDADPCCPVQKAGSEPAVREPRGDRCGEGASEARLRVASPPSPSAPLRLRI